MLGLYIYLNPDILTHGMGLHTVYHLFIDLVVDDIEKS